MSFRKDLDAYFEMAKPRITGELLLVAVMSYLMASGAAWSWWGLFSIVFSIGTLGTGIFALNHWFERDQDALMVRTKDRPVPSGRVGPVAARLFGWGFTLVGIAFSFSINLLTGVIALFTAVTYVAIYTPLKYKTAFHTALGALPGAVPPLAGWAIATGSLDVYAWVLFGVMCLWQFPHFLAIEMMYKEDYAKADVKVVPVLDKTGVATAWQVIVPTLLLIGMSFAPLSLGYGTWITAAVCVVFGLAFLWFGVKAVRTKEKMAARHLLRASVVYLPVVFALFYFHP